MMTTNESDLRPAAVFARLALLSVVAAALTSAVGYLPTQALAGPRGIGAMLAGIAIALAAALAGLVPVLLTLRLGPRERLNGMLTAMGIRFILTIGLLLAAVFSRILPEWPLALWTAIGYLLLLLVDTAGTVWLTSKATRATP